MNDGAATSEKELGEFPMKISYDALRQKGLLSLGEGLVVYFSADECDRLALAFSEVAIVIRQRAIKEAHAPALKQILPGR